MNPDDISNLLELRKLVLVVRKEGDTHTAVALFVGGRLHVGLVMHSRVDYFKKLATKSFFRVRARSVNHYAVQVIQLSIAEGCLGQRCVSMLAFYFGYLG